MNEDNQKLEWSPPELHILEFKMTSSGPLTGPAEDVNYSGTLEGS